MVRTVGMLMHSLQALTKTKGNNCPSYMHTRLNALHNIREVIYARWRTQFQLVRLSQVFQWRERIKMNGNKPTACTTSLQSFL